MDAPELTPEIIEFPAAQPVPSKAVLYAKLARVMGRVKRVAKSGKNTHFGYTFATADDMYDTVREALAEENVALLVDMLGVEREGKKTKVKFEFIFACGDTGAIKACQWESEADDTQDKGINKAATFAMKYFLKATFLISTGDIADDPDADAPVEDKKPAKPERRLDTSKNAPAPVKSAETEAGQDEDKIPDPYANLRAKVTEMIGVQRIEPRDTPGTVHVVLMRKVNSLPEFRKWLEKEFGKAALLNIGSDWFDIKWTQPDAGGNVEDV